MFDCRHLKKSSDFIMVENQYKKHFLQLQKAKKEGPVLVLLFVGSMIFTVP